MQANTTVHSMKQEVLRLVAQHAFAGDLDGTYESFPRQIIPGYRANFRCCVYKEREILKERVRLAMGQTPTATTNPGSDVIFVIAAACEGCPINRFQVTENCQGCLAHKCMEVCPKKAISRIGRKAHIDYDLCVECGRCAKACPYNAIADLQRPCKRSCPVGAISMNEDRLALIDESKCIECGSCVRECPFGAVADRSFMLPVIADILSGKPVYAVVAPAAEGQFGPKGTIGKLKNALVALGFAGAYEVALGADAVAKHEAEELAGVLARGGKMTTSCCPAFFNLIHKHYPKLTEFISHTTSPMNAISRYVKHLHEDGVTVFIGPCTAKKSEALRSDKPGDIDYVLTFDEILAMLEAKGIVVEECEDAPQEASIHAKRFASSGGVAGAVIQALNERGSIQLPYEAGSTVTVLLDGDVRAEEYVSCAQCAGAAECRKALLLLQNGKLPETLVEGMVCEGGCVFGPISLLPFEKATANRGKLLAGADSRSIGESLRQADFKGIDLER